MVPKRNECFENTQYLDKQRQKQTKTRKYEVFQFQT